MGGPGDRRDCGPEGSSRGAAHFLHAGILPVGSRRPSRGRHPDAEGKNHSAENSGGWRVSDGDAFSPSEHAVTWRFWFAARAAPAPRAREGLSVR